jgi:hypothetical protein
MAEAGACLLKSRFYFFENAASLFIHIILANHLTIYYRRGARYFHGIAHFNRSGIPDNILPFGTAADVDAIHTVLLFV